jgi:hypothetical protein
MQPTVEDRHAWGRIGVALLGLGIAGALTLVFRGTEAVWADILFGFLVVAAAIGLYFVIALAVPVPVPPIRGGELPPIGIKTTAVAVLAFVLASAGGHFALPAASSGPPGPGGRSPSPGPTLTASPPTPSVSFTYVEELSLSPPPAGKGQAYMNNRNYDHSVWYDARTTLSFDIPVAAKYQFLDVYVGQQDGVTAAATYDIKGDNETLVGMHGLGGGAEPEHLKIPITGRQVLTIDVVVYYGNAQTSRIVLGNARLLT